MVYPLIKDQYTWPSEQTLIPRNLWTLYWTMLAVTKEDRHLAHFPFESQVECHCLLSWHHGHHGCLCRSEGRNGRSLYSHGRKTSPGPLGRFIRRDCGNAPI